MQRAVVNILTFDFVVAVHTILLSLATKRQIKYPAID